MATRNQVLSLFGASPEQILEQRRQEQALEVLKQQDPYQRAGSAIGLGLARMFGGEPAEVTRQRELYGMLEGVNFDSPEKMRTAAASLQSQFPDRALQLLSMADQLETTQQQRATSSAQEAAAKKTANEVTRKFKTQVKVYEPLIPGGPAVEKTKEQIIDVTGTLNENGEFVPYGGQLDFLTAQGATVEPVSDLEDVDPQSVAIQNNLGADIRRTPSGDYVLVNDQEKVVRSLTDAEIKAIGAEKTEPAKPKPEMPFMEQKRTQVEKQIERDRVRLPSTAAEDQTNPFSN